VTPVLHSWPTGTDVPHERLRSPERSTALLPASWLQALALRSLASDVCADSARLRRYAARHRIRIAGGAAPAPRLVGVVDDDASVVSALTRRLSVAGFSVKAFGSGQALLGWHGLATLDCLVMDANLGALTGFDVHERLAATALACPIVFLNGHDDAVIEAVHAALDNAVR
jgi:CheY-like chemotaxis protein